MKKIKPNMNKTKSLVNEGCAIKRGEYMTRDDFIMDVVKSIEAVIEQALEDYGQWDDIPEIDANAIIQLAKPLFQKLGPWWKTVDLNVGVYAHFCKNFGAGPEPYVEYDGTMPPGYRKRVSFV